MSNSGSLDDSVEKRELEFTNLRLAQRDLETSFRRLNLRKTSRFAEVLENIEKADDLAEVLENIAEEGESTPATVIRRNRSNSITEATAQTLDDSITLINAHLSYLDLSGDSETWRKPFPGFENSMVENQQAMDQLTDLVRQLAQIQLQQQEQTAANQNLQIQQPENQRQRPGEVLKNVTNIIIKFDKNNIMNFLESVELALDMTPAAEDKLIVLKIAKQRVTGSVSIETKTYVTFAALKTDVLLAFKPKRSVVEIESMLNRLNQKDKETVDEYAKRAFTLKTEFEQATQADRIANGSVLDAVRLAEMERQVSRNFLNGLNNYVIRFVNERPPTMTEAVGVAMEAESISTQRFEMQKMEALSKKIGSIEKKPFTKNSPKNDEKKTFRNKTQEPIKCYHCGDAGHVKTKCPKLSEGNNQEVKILQTRPAEEKREYNKEGAKPKNGGACGASVSAKSVKLSKHH